MWENQNIIHPECFVHIARIARHVDTKSLFAYTIKPKNVLTLAKKNNIPIENTIEIPMYNFCQHILTHTKVISSYENDSK